jgi:CRISPR-associated endonuclease Cas3-HD
MPVLKTETLTIRLCPATKAALRQAAKQEHRSLSNMIEVMTHFRYWGKADPAVESGLTWHPFAYHSLDVAAVAGAFWEQSPAIRRTFANAFGTEETAIGRLRAWVLFFVALHDLGKLHALFQIKAPHALALAWPELDPKTLLTNKAPKGYDHGSEGFRLAMSELSTWTNNSDRRWLKTWSPWMGAVTGHHGEIPGNDKPIAGYADKPIREQDANARHDWIKEAAGLFLESAGLSLADYPPPCSHAARNLLAGFCSLCDWIGSNTEVFRYVAPGMAPVDYFDLQAARVSDDDTLRRFGLIAPAKAYQGVSALLKTDETPRGIQVMIDGLSTAAGLTIVEAPTGSGKTEAALAYAWRLLDAGVAESIVFAFAHSGDRKRHARALSGLCGRCVRAGESGARPRSSRIEPGVSAAGRRRHSDDFARTGRGRRTMRRLASQQPQARLSGTDRRLHHRSGSAVRAASAAQLRPRLWTPSFGVDRR